MTNINTGGLTQAQTDALYPSKDVVQPVTPTTGQTVQMTDDSRNGTLVLSPAGTLATLTVVLPSDANSVVGQYRSVSSTKAITLLTVNGATTIFNAPTVMSAGDLVTFKKTAPNTWMRTI